MTVFFPIEANAQVDSVLVLHALVDVIAPTKIIDIFNIQSHIKRKYECFLLGIMCVLYPTCVSLYRHFLDRLGAPNAIENMGGPDHNSVKPTKEM